jgi:hypothetical protein
MPDQPNRPRSWAETFGEPTPSRFQDQLKEPGPWSSAARHARRVQRREREAIENRQLQQLQRLAAEQDLDQALDHALELVQRGVRVPDKLRVKAMAALERRGGSGLSSAEIMVQRRLLAQGWSRDR